jgi:recombination protein RecT
LILKKSNQITKNLQAKAPITGLFIFLSDFCNSSRKYVNAKDIPKEVKEMAKTASTESLQKAMEQKQQVAPTNTGVDPYRKAQSYLKAMLPAITEALPKSKGMDAERLTRMTLTTLKTNPKLLECSIESLLACTLQSAQLGLEPNLLGSCYFVPYKGQVSFQIGYKGLIDLVTRKGEVINIVAQEVRQGDEFTYEYGRNETLRHIPAANAKRGEIEYFYAYANMKNGGFAFQVMHISDIEKIRDNYSMSYKFDKAGSIWGKHFSEMALKTVIKRLIKYLPISVETQSLVAQDETVRKDITAEAIFVSPEPEEVEVIDAS